MTYNTLLNDRKQLFWTVFSRMLYNNVYMKDRDKGNPFGEDLTGPGALLRDLEAMPSFDAKGLGKFKDNEALETAIGDSVVKSGGSGDKLETIELDTSGI